MRSASLKICLLLALGASLFMSGCGPLSAHFAIADAQVAIKTKAGATATNLNMFAVNYNVLRIQSGMGGLAFSN